MSDHNDLVSKDQPYRLIEKTPTVQFSHPYQEPATIIENQRQINGGMNLNTPFASSEPNEDPNQANR